MPKAPLPEICFENSPITTPERQNSPSTLEELRLFQKISVRLTHQYQESGPIKGEKHRQTADISLALSNMY